MLGSAMEGVLGWRDIWGIAGVEIWVRCGWGRRDPPQQSVLVFVGYLWVQERAHTPRRGSVLSRVNILEGKRE